MVDPKSHRSTKTRASVQMCNRCTYFVYVLVTSCVEPIAKIYFCFPLIWSCFKTFAWVYTCCLSRSLADWLSFPFFFFWVWCRFKLFFKFSFSPLMLTLTLTQFLAVQRSERFHLAAVLVNLLQLFLFRLYTVSSTQWKTQLASFYAIVV